MNGHGEQMSDSICESCHGSGIGTKRFVWPEPVFPSKKEKEIIANALWALCNYTLPLPDELNKYREALRNLDQDKWNKHE